MSKERTSASGIGFAGMLSILFIGLKLTNYIDWSWWWVLSPLWIGLVFILAILIMVAMWVMIRRLIFNGRK